ncbi:hypothetical protein HBA55_20950 [Pseudomaricurvus alkylphenolicus]|uniref:tetratricopeptide repeat protein n=1 Tax=Pseudomaricurvus alkylphenolicus TaxID=1306991 RepID=UPI0014242276|nr:tetratricopeptide repeat protein [Pseudomaricurvus alkylphenolicus]NIB42087.1 hypothetical protein [Pseudomaricurvus alkylphenolicus]
MSDSKSILEEAQNLFTQREYQAARDKLLPLVDPNGKGSEQGPVANLLLSQVYEAQGDYQAAHELYRLTVKQYPGEPVTCLRWGRLLTKLHYPQEAARIFQLGLSDTRHRLELTDELAKAKMASGDFKDANQWALKALELAPGHPVGLFTLAKVSKCRGLLPRANNLMRECLSKLLESPPKASQRAAQRNAINIKLAEDLLWKTLSQLESAGVHAFAHAGTLLGLEREGHLLPYDKDMDIGLPFEEIPAALELLTRNGWMELDASYGLVNPRALFHRETGHYLDLCGFQVESGNSVTIGGFWCANIPSKWNRITEFPALQLQRVSKEVGDVWYVAEPAKWLEAMYGDWRTPDPEFDTVVTARNLRGFSPLTQYYTLMKIIKYWWDGRINKALSLCEVFLRHLPKDELLLQIRGTLRALVREQQP